MSKAIQAAQKAARKAIERGYTGVATITEYQEIMLGLFESWA